MLSEPGTQAHQSHNILFRGEWIRQGSALITGHIVRCQQKPHTQRRKNATFSMGHPLVSRRSAFCSLKQTAYSLVSVHVVERVHQVQGVVGHDGIVYLEAIADCLLATVIGYGIGWLRGG